jgi:branched-chain amino acid aminotransferase
LSLPIRYDDWPDDLKSLQRAVYYADALFETIRVSGGRLCWWPYHWERLTAGLLALGYELPAPWTADFFEREILKIAPSDARVRLTVWRSPGGLYYPDCNTPLYVIEAKPLPQLVALPPPRLTICTSVRLPMDAFSNFKTLNAARYVAAAREARTRGYDDGLLLNSAGRVCEATSSNLMWWQGDTLCTPALSEGCVAGVMRRVVLEKARATGIPVLETTCTPEQLAAAEAMFLTNAIRGMVPVGALDGRVLVPGE